MHALDMLEYGHQLVLDTVAGLNEQESSTSGVCGFWSVKDILAHFISYEVILIEALTKLNDDNTRTPMLTRWIPDTEQFNAEETALRREKTLTQLVDEYTECYEIAINLLIHTAPARLTERGALAWYGSAYDVEDFLVYSFYAHKREHCAQIAVYRDSLASIPNHKISAA